MILRSLDDKRIEIEESISVSQTQDYYFRRTNRLDQKTLKNNNHLLYDNSAWRRHHWVYWWWSWKWFSTNYFWTRPMKKILLDQIWYDLDDKMITIQGNIFSRSILHTMASRWCKPFTMQSSHWWIFACLETHWHNQNKPLLVLEKNFSFWHLSEEKGWSKCNEPKSALLYKKIIYLSQKHIKVIISSRGEL